MTVNERKERQRFDREQLFLDKAAQLIASEGILQLQMAPLARACEYATGTLYQHFSSKEDLLLALVARNGCNQLKLFQQIAALAICNRHKILALCVAEELAREYHPSHARLEQYVFTEVVWENASASRRQMILDNSKPLSELVSGIVGAALAAGELPDHQCTALELSIAPWALCTGSHNLEQTSGLLAAFGLNKDPLQRYRLMHLLLNGMQWQPLQDLNDTAALAAQLQQLRQQVAPLFSELCQLTVE